MKISFFHFLIIFALTGCIGSGDNPTDSLFGSSDVIEVPVPTPLSIDITYPTSDGERVGYQGTVGGNCSPSGKSIEVTAGGTTTYSVCLGNSWESQFDVSSAAVGNVTVTAKMVDGTNVSFPSTRIFNKFSNECDSETNRNDTFANFSTTGDGSSSNPWIICNAIQLANIDNSAALRDDYYELHNEIHNNDGMFIPLNGPIAVNFEGNNFTIRNLNMTVTYNEVGIFRYTMGATISNLKLYNVSASGNDRVGALVGWVRESATPTVFSNITGTVKVSGRNEVGGIFGRIGRDNNGGRETYATLSNISVETYGTGVSASNSVGAVVGYVVNNQGSFSASNLTATNVTVSSTASYAGGIFGQDTETAGTWADLTVTGGTISAGASYGGGVGGRLYGSVTNSTSSATVFAAGTGSYFGGLYGQMNGTLSGTCTSSGLINATTSNYVGGVIGILEDNKTIANCSATGVVAGNDRVGGLVGFLDNNAQINGGTFTNTISGNNYIGGIFGYTDPGVTIQNIDLSSVSNQTVTGNSQVGGIGGRTRYPATLTNLHSAATVTGTAGNIGGLIGYTERDNTITNTSATGTVTGTQRIGGLVGYAGRNTDISNSFASGNVTGSTGYVGGLVGYSDRYNNYDTCYATGNVENTTSGDYVGGLDGGTNQADRTVRNSFATGNVTAPNSRFVGGLTGYARGTNQSYINNFAIGNVVGREYVGGLYGYFNRQSGTCGRWSYALGQVSRASGSTASAARFGPLYGTQTNTNASDDVSLFYNSANVVLDVDTAGPLAGANTIGTGQTDANLRIQTTYSNAPANFDFTTPFWDMPVGNLNIPNYGDNYPYPVPQWVQ